MAKVSQLSHIKSVRTKAGLPSSILAKALGVTESDLRGWEKDASKASEAQLRDLAIVLDTPVCELLGVKAEDSDALEPRFAPSLRSGLDYGTLRLVVGEHAFEYPIDRAASEKIRTVLEGRDPQDDSEEPECWLAAWSLNDKLIYINLEHASEIELIGDDVEQMPPYEHPEVYRMLGLWEIRKDVDETMGPVLKARCEAYINAHGEDESNREATNARVVTKDGRSGWHFLLENEDTIGYHVLELESGRGIQRNRFIRVLSEGYYRARYVNLSQVALIEVPATRYFTASLGE